MSVEDGDVIRAVCNISLPDLVVAQNVYYWRLDDPDADHYTNGQVTNKVGTKLQAMYEDLEPNLPDSVTVLDAEVERVEWETDHWETKENVGIATLAIVGDDAVNDMVPHGVAGLITMHTDRPQTRARKYIPGLLESQMTDSDFGGTLLAALTAFAVEWLLPEAMAGTGEIVPVVLGTSGPSAGLIYALVSAAVNSIAAYQRRRKPGVGS